jgi:hypothetical protein
MAKATGHGGRDSPDYGVSDTYLSQTQTLDLGELAVRLGASTLFDRTGTLIYCEQFQGGLNSWLTSGSGANCDPVLSGTYFYHKPYSVRFKTAGLGTVRSVLHSKLPFPYQTRMGVEFAYNQGVPVNIFDCYMDLYTGTQLITPYIRLDFTNNKVQIRDKDYNWVDVHTGTSGPGYSGIFNPIKLVFDLETAFYTRVMLNENDYNVSTTEMLAQSSTQESSLSIFFALAPTSDVVEELYLDNIVVTLDEPA